jgi:hypothetical protein
MIFSLKGENSFFIKLQQLLGISIIGEDSFEQHSMMNMMNT